MLTVKVPTEISHKFSSKSTASWSSYRTTGRRRRGHSSEREKCVHGNCCSSITA